MKRMKQSVENKVEARLAEFKTKQISIENRMANSQKLDSSSDVHDWLRRLSDRVSWLELSSKQKAAASTSMNNQVKTFADAPAATLQDKRIGGSIVLTPVPIIKP